jgi:hypothetical protein
MKHAVKMDHPLYEQVASGEELADMFETPAARAMKRANRIPSTPPAGKGRRA